MHILKDGKPYAIDLTNELDHELMRDWWADVSNRRVAFHELGAGLRLSTVFLTIDHGFNGRSLWFESMVLTGNAHDLECVRYETIEQARAGHANLLRTWKKKKRQLKKLIARRRAQDRRWTRRHKDQGHARRFMVTQRWVNGLKREINKPAILPQMLKVDG